jgi:hypothetical protein
MDEIICYGQHVYSDHITEYYLTGNGHATRRARVLRNAGFKVISVSMGRQLTKVGSVKLTAMKITPGEIRKCNEHWQGDLKAVFPVRIEPI